MVEDDQIDAALLEELGELSEVLERAAEPVEHPHEPAHERQRLSDLAGVVVHLATAGLLAREIELQPEALEEGDHRPSGLRKQRVGQTRDEDRGTHRQAGSSQVGALTRTAARRLTWRGIGQP